MIVMARISEFHLGIATLLFAACATALVIAEPFRYRDRPPKTFVVHAAEVNGRVRVDWNPADVRDFKADAGVLRVQDGEMTHEYPIDRRTLETGGLDYLRKSDDVLLSLTLMGEGKPRTQVMVRTVISTPPPVSEPLVPEAQTRARRR
jgi:hypothetical protein